MSDSLHAISPVDGRYRAQVDQMGDYFSEFALIRYRVRVEIEYFIALCELPLPQLANFDKDLFEELRAIYLDFSDADALAVKEIERTTNHDVKAVEYFIRRRFTELDINPRYAEFIHFGLTSQDINNTSVPLSFKEGIADVFLPMLDEVTDMLQSFADEWADVPMLAHTHGQPASPTRLGKEINVFVSRICEQRRQLDNLS